MVTVAGAVCRAWWPRDAQGVLAGLGRKEP